MFLKKITSKLMHKPEAAGPVTCVAAFGKHPGWDDHVDDMGLETDLLVATKRQLYVEGIGGNIDSGAWERLAEDQRLPGFDHVFFWRAAGIGASRLIVGRFWSSRDGKGRTRYPMVVCAQCEGSDAWAAAKVLPVLERLKGECERASSANTVRAAVEAAGAEVAAAAAAQGDTRTEARPGLMAFLASRPEMGEGSMGLLRILYQVDREMAAYRGPAGGSGGRTRSVDLRPQHLRVPACADTPGDVAATWLAFLARQLDPASSALVLVPLGQPWADVIVGEPTGAQFFCIRAGQKSIPLTSDIPYTLDGDFLSRAGSLIRAS